MGKEEIGFGRRSANEIQNAHFELYHRKERCLITNTKLSRQKSFSLTNTENLLKVTNEQLSLEPVGRILLQSVCVSDGQNFILARNYCTGFKMAFLFCFGGGQESAYANSIAHSPISFYAVIRNVIQDESLCVNMQENVALLKAIYIYFMISS